MGDAGRVRGAHTDAEVSPAVDATGRGSRAPHWPAITLQAEPRTGRPGQCATTLPVERDEYEWQTNLPGSLGGTPTTANCARRPGAGHRQTATEEATVNTTTNAGSRALGHWDAVIIGGGYAGLLAAAVVAHAGHDVLVLEAGAEPGASPAAIPALPALPRLHWTRALGDGLDHAVYDATRQLLAAGAHRSAPPAGDPLTPGGTWPARARDLVTCSSRLSQRVLRDLVLAGPGYDRQTTLRHDARVVGLLGDRTRVRGVRLRNGDGTQDAVTADLVVDASGARSRAPAWLNALRVPGVPALTLGSPASYLQRTYRGPVGSLLPSVARASADPSLSGTPTAALAVRVEGGQWSITLIGVPADALTGDPAVFERLALSLRHSVIDAVICGGTPATRVGVVRAAARRRHRFEKAGCWPARFVVLGDAVAAFDPTNGLGLTVAERSAMALRQEMGKGMFDPTLARRCQRAIGRIVKAAWETSAVAPA
ncbi:NAD(P)/FAD-dependent oxidoreductase [Streptomyces sp. NPDC012746]|uniref:NAD(P)/FAD-dependent oxidoreductase n=1 Tax=Streptomyces sp. NPDC012746 TaxID=3364845 RepID=UPI00369AB087